MANTPLIIITLLLFSVISLRVESRVTYREEASIVAKRNLEASGFFINRDVQDGSDSKPHIIYYPFLESCNPPPSSGELTEEMAVDTKSFTLVSNPHLNAPCIKENGELSGILSLPITSSEIGTLYGGIKTSSENFKVIELEETISEKNARNDLTLDLGDLCTQHSCLLPSNQASETTVELLIFVSPSTDPYFSGDHLDDDNQAFKRGSVFHLKLSRKIPSPVQTLGDRLTLIPWFKLFAGDSSVFISYRQGNLSLNEKEIHSLKIFVYPQPYNEPTFYSCTQEGQYCKTSICGADTLCKTESFLGVEEKPSGEVIFYNLINSQEAHISLCLENKWGFCSLLPPSQTVTPIELENFLREQSCFFFSAAFGREHFVIKDLKWLRDRVLKRHFLGRKFVELYYLYAPRYAPYVAQNPFLKTIIRQLGYFFSFKIKLLQSLSSSSLFAKHN